MASEMRRRILPEEVQKTEGMAYFIILQQFTYRNEFIPLFPQAVDDGAESLRGRQRVLAVVQQDDAAWLTVMEHSCYYL